MADSARLYELRTYTAAPGRLAALERRFRDHTLGLFAAHGLEVVGFWRGVDPAGEPSGTLVYLLAFDDRAAADRAWEAFRDDPAWLAAKAASEADGPLAEFIESVTMVATDSSPIA